MIKIKYFRNQLNSLLGICAVTAMLLLSSCGSDNERGNINEDGNYGYGADVDESRQPSVKDIDTSNQDTSQFNGTPDAVNPNSGGGSVPTDSGDTNIDNNNTGGGNTNNN